MALFGEPGHRPLQDLLSADENSPSADDQRERPRSGPIEEIADIAYDTLRKHKVVEVPENSAPSPGKP